MKISELKKIVLINPAKTGFTELFIVSGYASATFLNSHLKILEETINCKIKIIRSRKSSYVCIYTYYVTIINYISVCYVMDLVYMYINIYIIMSV